MFLVEKILMILRCFPDPGSVSVWFPELGKKNFFDDMNMNE
jgi:hypothetical protein